MKNGNNNSPPPYILEYWLKGLFSEGISVNKKIIKTKSKKKEETK